MLRVGTLFVLASLAFLCIGLVTTRIPNHPGIAIHWGDRAYGFSLQAVFTGVAFLFCGFAFIHEIGYIPMGRSLGLWHFWLSLGSVALWGAGYAALGYLGPRAVPNASLGASGIFLAISYLLSIPLFLIAQGCFAGGLIWAVLHMRGTAN